MKMPIQVADEPRMKDEKPTKMVTLEMVEGDRFGGKPARRWSDDTVDWCGCTLTEAAQLALDRMEWRKITGLSGLNGPHGL